MLTTQTRPAFNPESGHKRLDLQRNRRLMDTGKSGNWKRRPMSDAKENSAELLREIARHCAANLQRNETAKEYLRGNGITQETAWSAFRLGAGDDAMIGEIGAEPLKAAGLLPRRDQFLLSPCGVIIPTFDPRQPEHPLGLIKQNYVQNKHAFITAPLGVACSTDIAAARQVVITDTPFLGLRLAQAGAKGVVIAEVPEVLPPLVDWLKDREIIIASYKRDGLAKLKAALGTVPASEAFICCELERTDAATLASLGIKKELLPTEPEPVPPQTLLLNELVVYAQGRLKAGLGRELLESFDIADAGFIETYAIGYLPPDYHSALQREDKRSLRGKKLGGSLIVPAYDEQGAVADVFAINGDRTNISLAATLSGMLAPKIATAFEDIFVTDSFRLMVSLFRQGKTNTLLLRGLEDATLNAERLARSGVRTVQILARRNANEIAAVLGNAGLGVQRLTFPRIDEGCELKPAAEASEPVVAPPTIAEAEPAPAAAEPKITLAKYDEKSERAIFSAGEATYTVGIDPEGGSKLEVSLERGGTIHLDRFDLASEPQRNRFAKSAALKTQVPFETVELHLIAILNEVRTLQDRLSNPEADAKTAATMTEAERGEALAFLRRPDLLDAIATGMENLGWVGEDKTKRLLYLVAVSRKLATPLSSALIASSGAGKSKCIETIAELTPPEDTIHVSRLTDSALYYHDRDALRHKLLIIDEADALSAEVMVALRVLQSRGALSQSHVTRDPSTNQTTSHLLEARGPVAVLTSSAGEIETQMLSRCYRILVDESPAQTQRILAAQRRQRVDPEAVGAESTRMKIVQLHRNVQRLLDAKAVLIPFADRIQFPTSSIKYRRTQERFLNLIEASALLHQFQRLKQRNKSGEELIIATEADFEIALSLAAESIAHECDELSLGAREVLEAVVAARLNTFDMNALQGLKPDWTRYKFRAALDELVQLEVLVSQQRTRPRQYHLALSSCEFLQAPVVRLTKSKCFGDLAAIGETDFANTSPKAAIG